MLDASETARFRRMLDDGCALARSVRTGEGRTSWRERNALYERACGARDGEGCAKIAVAVYCGAEQQPDAPSALRWFLDGCSLGDSGSCGGAAAMLITAAGVPGDLPGAQTLLRESCDRGVAGSCIYLSYIAASLAPTGTERTATALLHAACELGDEATCRKLGVAVPAVNTTPIPAWEARKTEVVAGMNACMRASPELCLLKLGRLLREGPAEAVELLSHACAGDSADTCLALAGLHGGGRHGDGDDAAKAATYLRRTCERGQIVRGAACRILADSGERGIEPD